MENPWWPRVAVRHLWSVQWGARRRSYQSSRGNCEVKVNPHLPKTQCFNRVAKGDDLQETIVFTSSTAQGGGGSFKNRKPIGEICCCESGMAERIHWWTERCLRSPLFLSLFLWLSTHLPTYLFYLSIYLTNYLSVYLSIYLSVCLSVDLSICGAVSFSVM